MEVLKCWKIVEFPKISIKIKIVKHFTMPKQRVAFRKLFSLPSTHPSPNKKLLRFWNKHFLMEIYRNTQTFAFKVLQECSSWAPRNGAVQIFFSDTKQKHVCWKICKVRKDFGCAGAAYYFQSQLTSDS